jgi:hypothetical protein
LFCNGSKAPLLFSLLCVFAGSLVKAAEMCDDGADGEGGESDELKGLTAVRCRPMILDNPSSTSASCMAGRAWLAYLHVSRFTPHTCPAGLHAALACRIVARVRLHRRWFGLVWALSVVGAPVRRCTTSCTARCTRRPCLPTFPSCMYAVEPKPKAGWLPSAHSNSIVYRHARARTHARTRAHVHATRAHVHTHARACRAHARSRTCAKPTRMGAHMHSHTRTRLPTHIRTRAHARSLWLVCRTGATSVHVHRVVGTPSQSVVLLFRCTVDDPGRATGRRWARRRERLLAAPRGRSQLVDPDHRFPARTQGRGAPRPSTNKQTN